MNNLELSIQDIKDLMETFSRNKLGSLKLQAGDFSLELEGQKVEQVYTVTGGDGAVAIPVYESAENETSAPAGNVVNSPIVGTFYAAPSPDKDPFVQVGSKVNKGDVLFIIESMKLMNEVTSEYSGIVREILVENAQGVEYGQPILVIE